MTGMDELPPLVLRAQQMARELGFPLTRDEAGPGRPSASLPGTGRFLAMLAAGCGGGRIGELGTGTGIGAAWLASAMPADCTLVTAERDERRAAAAASLFAGDPRVRVLTGDALAMLTPYAPFDLLFSDCGAGSAQERLGLVRVGGRIVSDDVTPEAALPAGSPLRHDDPKRAFFFGTAGLVSVEVVLPDLANSLLAGTRVA
jgi:predicted O-methyltransferase YrrM